MKLSKMDLADEVHPKKIASLLLSLIRKDCNGVVPIPVPVKEICLQLDIKSIEPIPAKSLDGMLVIGENDDEGSAFIFINSNQSDYRIRFTIGHELGHWLIAHHTINQKKFSCSNEQMQIWDFHKEITPAGRKELEANLFSCELLLPEVEFKHDLRMHTEPVVSQIVVLSEKYKVSKLATARRFVELNDHPCAVIQSKDKIITHIYKNKIFPTIALQRNNPLPPRSFSFSSPNSHTGCSKQQLAEWRNWLKEHPEEGSELFEQVLYQQEGYRMTLLFLDTSQCLDEEELADQKLELKEPYFFKR